jgi:hypothetical protein
LRATSVASIVAEMAQQDRPAAARRLDQCGERVQPVALGRAAVRLHLLLDPLPRQREILCRPEQPGLSRFAVAPGAAGLLVIGLDALGDRRMRDQPHIGLVDPHAECDGGGDHHLFRIDERSLVGGAQLRLQPGMVG